MIRIAVEEVWIRAENGDREPACLARLRDALVKEPAGPFWSNRRTTDNGLIGVTVVTADVTSIDRVRAIIRNWIVSENDRG